MTEAQKTKFKELKESGQFKKAKDEIFWLIRNIRENNLENLYTYTGRKHSTVSGRVSDLLDDGVIKESGIAPNGQSYYCKSVFTDIQKLKNKRIAEKENRCVKTLLSSKNISNKTKQFLLSDSDNKIINSNHIDVIDTAIITLLKVSAIKKDIKLLLIEQWMMLHNVDPASLSEEDKSEIIKKQTI